MNARRRLVLSLIVLLVVFLAGSAGYMTLAGATAGEAAYMTLVTLSTVGFREVVQLDGPGRLWTAALIVLGIGVVSMAFTSMVTLFVGGEIRSVLGRRKVQQKIDRLKGHAIFCGFGRMGAMAARKIAARGVEVVVIESDQEQVPDLEAAVLVHVI
ncbi:MAG: NAD-binding protein, partial [Planctomycetes bacterium]|nr:NAD-binding protein [Planctomycetota bacterium]